MELDKLTWEESWTNLSAPQAPASSERGRELEDSFMSAGRLRRTSTPNPNTDCLHPAAQKPSPAADGLWAAQHIPSNCSYCLSSAQTPL